MKICVCFTGQPRTVEDCGFNLNECVINTTTHETTIIYCTWLDESTEYFTWHFPNAIIHLITRPTMESEEFQHWIQQCSISDCNNDILFIEKLYNSYLMWYCIRETARFAETLHKASHFDLCIRIRPDCIFNQQIQSLYDTINIPERTIMVTPWPSYGGICDFFWLGRFHETITVMKFLDHCQLNPELCKYDNMNVTYRRLHPEQTLKVVVESLQYDMIPINGLMLELIRESLV